MNPVDVIRRESDLFYAAAGHADPSRDVPSTPGWSVADLVRHLGEVHWFWATDIEVRATEPAEVERLAPDRPNTFKDLLAWGRSQAERLAHALEVTDDDVRVWTWAPDDADHTVGFIRRHQVQEAAVHRWDMQRAASPDQADAIDPGAASDAIDEFLTVTVPWSVRADKPLPGSVHIHCTDTEGEWLLHSDGVVERIHAKGTVAIRGTASDILLALYKRIPLDALELVGEQSLADELVGRVNTE